MNEASSKLLRWVHGEVKTPPMSEQARREMGMLLRKLQQGEQPSMPHSRPMPSVAPHCYELRVNDVNKTWRLIYRTDPDAIVVLDVFEKKANRTPQQVIENCQRRLRTYEVGKR